MPQFLNYSMHNYKNRRIGLNNNFPHTESPLNMWKSTKSFECIIIHSLCVQITFLLSINSCSWTCPCLICRSQKPEVLATVTDLSFSDNPLWSHLYPQNIHPQSPTNRRAQSHYFKIILGMHKCPEPLRESSSFTFEWSTRLTESCLLYKAVPTSDGDRASGGCLGSCWLPEKVSGRLCFNYPHGGVSSPSLAGVKIVMLQSFD